MNQNYHFNPDYQSYFSYSMSVPYENAYPHTTSYFYHHHYNTRPSPPTSINNNNQLIPFHFHTTNPPQARALLPDTYQTSEKKKSKTPKSPSLVQRISVINFSRRIKSIDKFLQNQLTQRRSLSVPAKKSKARAVPNEYINVRTSCEEVEETRDVDSEGSVGEFLREEETMETVATEVPMVETYESLSHLNISFDDNSNNNETKDEINKNNCNLEDDQDIDLNDFWRLVENSEAAEISRFRTAAYWSYLPESGQFLSSMSKSEQELQERWFEIYTSERSYNKTLKILDSVLINESKSILTTYDLNSVFTLNEVRSIIDMSDKFLEACERKLAASVKITTMFDILSEMCCDESFAAYLKYASFQYSQKENFDRLMNENQLFNRLIKCLLNDKRLEGRDVLSFLIAPLQRLPRYKLLVDAVLKLVDHTEVYAEGEQLSKLIDQQLIKANEKTSRFISYSEAIKLKLKMKYPDRNMIVHDLITASRELKFHGDLELLNPILFSRFTGSASSASFKRNSFGTNSKLIYHLILFNDILIVTKKEIKDKVVYYFVKNIYEKHLVNADLSEWQSVLESSIYSKLNPNLLNNTKNNEMNFYFLTLSILTKSRKYFFLCSKSDGKNWLKHLSN